MNIPITDYVESATCVDCEKDGRECVVLKLEAYEGPHCIKCVMRAAKKRQKLTKSERTDGMQAALDAQNAGSGIPTNGQRVS